MNIIIMLINWQTLDHLCKLSMLELTDQQKQDFLPKLESILWYVWDLQKINTDDINLEYKVVRESMQVNEQIIENKDNMLANTTHSIKNNQIVIKSPIKN